MDSIQRDTKTWITRLLAVWRRARNFADGPDDRLLPLELREVANSVRILSQGLTRERELVGGRYMEDPKLLGGYLLFYWPISYAQARHALKEIPTRLRKTLDLGSGPGPLSFACIDAGASQVTAADRSPAALKLVRELACEAGEAISTRAWNALGERKPGQESPKKKERSRPSEKLADLSEETDGKFDLITMGHVVNELWSGAKDAIPRRAAVIQRAMASLEESGLLLILEPALRETSRDLLLVRDRLISDGHEILSPCLFKGPCPALQRATDWCHSERAWEPPKLVQEIARAAGLHKEALKMSYLLIKPGANEGARELRVQGENAGTEASASLRFRIVSEPLASKGRLRYMGCGPTGRIGLALQEKHITDANSAFSKLDRGDVIEIEGFESRGDGLSLGENSRIKIVARAGQLLKPNFYA